MSRSTDSRQTTIAVRAEQWTSVDERGAPDQHYVSFPGAGLVSGWTAAKAREAARDHAQTALLDAAWHADAGRHRRVIYCADGTLLLVFSSYRDSYAYEIHGAGRQHVTFCPTGRRFADAVVTARQHAAGSFGGVTWESGSYVEPGSNGRSDSSAQPAQTGGVQ